MVTVYSSVSNSSLEKNPLIARTRQPLKNGEPLFSPMRKKYNEMKWKNQIFFIFRIGKNEQVE